MEAFQNNGELDLSGELPKAGTTQKLSDLRQEITLDKNQKEKIAAYLISSGLNYDRTVWKITHRQWLELEMFSSYEITDKDIEAAKLLLNRLIDKWFDPEVAWILVSTFRLDKMQKNNPYWYGEVEEVTIDFDVSDKDIEATRLLYERLIREWFDSKIAGILLSSFSLDEMQKHKSYWYGEADDVAIKFDISDKDIEAAKLLYNRLISKWFSIEIAWILVSTFRLDYMQKNWLLYGETDDVAVKYDVSDKDIEATKLLYDRLIEKWFAPDVAWVLLRKFKLDEMQKNNHLSPFNSEEDEIAIRFDISDEDIAAAKLLYKRIMDKL